MRVSDTNIGHVRWQIVWQYNGFNVSIPSCTGELGRGEERRMVSFAEVRRRVKSWSLGMSLAELAEARSGAWHCWQRRGAELGRGEERSLAEARSRAWQR